ncbi:MAG: SusD/RagB family nutrient-binding outer membrane lipoprotein, partial [Flavisolibacter sp.]|nr:SusD/RagB family nutrient-binding outer membrane lipoprotein [Flavisolibacter sp.]
GLRNRLPFHTSQDSIYKKINDLIDGAISDLQKGSGSIVPRNDDVIFKGNTAKWIAAAWTLKARYALHLS